MTCQSVMQPSTAEYWHIGAMTMRLRSSRAPTRNGVNSALIMSSPYSMCSAAREKSSHGVSKEHTRTTSGEGREDRFPELCQEVVRTKPDVIVTAASRLVLAFKAATDTVPVVAVMSDPVAYGIA